MVVVPNGQPTDVECQLVRVTALGGVALDILVCIETESETMLMTRAPSSGAQLHGRRLYADKVTLRREMRERPRGQLVELA
jgi:hypothetical protein